MMLSHTAKTPIKSPLFPLSSGEDWVDGLISVCLNKILEPK